MVSNPHPIIETRYRVRHVLLIHNAVCVAVNVRVIAHRNLVTHQNPTTIIEQNVPVNHDIIADIHVVTKRKLNMLKGFEIRAATIEDVSRKQSSQLDTKLHVLPAEYGAIERVPEPEKWFHLLKLFIITLGVILGLEGDIA